MIKVFIDGSAGTTGLKIYERLSCRSDIDLIKLSDDKRKDTEYRRDALNSADIAFLCLPDQAAIEAVSLIENDNTVVIDTST
ncbi:MAG: N-acetyl-gamma-glutamyl-phosphate reductase, partial [Clostridiales bacterium]|nr:N-acetyl-gamma-glutamyl-phosphate reductase [Clostridiales bacterium]